MIGSSVLYRILLSGILGSHTDSRGSAEYNQKLSESRALAAAQEILRSEISPSRITTVGYGLTRPVDTNDTESGRQNNRRVEVKIFASDEYKLQVGEAR